VRVIDPVALVKEPKQGSTLWIFATVLVPISLILAFVLFVPWLLQSDQRAADAFCNAVDSALACQGSDDECLVAYHLDVTPRLAAAKTGQNPMRLNDLDAIYDEGKEALLARHTASTEALAQKRIDIKDACFDNLNSD
jgi:hypothetical protein